MGVSLMGGMIEPGGSPLEHVVQHPLKTVKADLGDFLTQDGVVTILSDHIVMMIVAGLLLMILMPMLVRRRRGKDEVGCLVPAGPANAIETVCQYLRTEVAEPSLGPHTDRFIKFIWTTFFFILTINLLGILPIAVITPLTLGLHIGGTATANLWVTGSMALVALGMMVVNGLRLGGKDYLLHFAPGPPVIKPLMLVIELFGLVIKPSALAIRLFANMVAGHTLLAVLLGFILSVGSAYGTVAGVGIAIPVILGSVAINLLEIFVAFLQAFIFTFLMTLFLGMSTVFHHDEDHGEAQA